MNHKVRSFTLSELLIVMIITVIVVGLAFSVLNLVKKEILAVEKNYTQSTSLSFFKQQIWLDFNKNSVIYFVPQNNQIILKSELDSIYYNFDDRFVLRNNDTLKIKIEIEKLYFEGIPVKEGKIDGFSFFRKDKEPNSLFFVFKKNDATLLMNQDGF